MQLETKSRPTPIDDIIENFSLLEEWDDRYRYVMFLIFAGDSDAHIVRGLVAILIALLSGRAASEISGENPLALFERLGLGEHLTPQRSNGFRSMVARTRADAAAALAEAV
jgi:cysteine desulfuration protein SufE